MTAVQRFTDGTTTINLQNRPTLICTHHRFSKQPRTLREYIDLPGGGVILVNREVTGWNWAFEVVFGGPHATARTNFNALQTLLDQAATKTEADSGTAVEYQESFGNESSTHDFVVAGGQLIEDRELLKDGSIRAELIFVTQVEA